MSKQLPLRGDGIERPKARVLVAVPPGRIPSVSEGAVIELLKPVYGFADAPRAWHRSFTKALASMDCVALKLDPFFTGTVVYKALIP